MNISYSNKFIGKDTRVLVYQELGDTSYQSKFLFTARVFRVEGSAESRNIEIELLCRERQEPLEMAANLGIDFKLCLEIDNHHFLLISKCVILEYNTSSFTYLIRSNGDLCMTMRCPLDNLIKEEP